MTAINGAVTSRALALPVVGALIVAVLTLVGGQAFAACTPGAGDPTCPSPAVFQQKYDNGFFDRANGVNTDKVLATPLKDHDHFITKYGHYYDNHPGQQAGLREHANKLANNGMIRAGARRWMARSYLRQHPNATRAAVTSHTTCFFPLSKDCMAQMEWNNLIINASCVGWHSWPNIDRPETCNRIREPGPNQTGISWDDFFNGLMLTGCTVGSGVAIFAVVATRGEAQAAWGAGSAMMTCAASYWESFHN